MLRYTHYHNLSSRVLIGLYKTMLRVHLVQKKIEEEYPKDEMHTPVHLCLGQEAIPAGVCAHLRKDDHVYSNHRGHGHYLAKGGDLRGLVSELYCKENGCSKARGGSMHTVDPRVGLMGSSSIVAGGIPLATGSALAFKLRKERRVSVVFFGDGAVEEGVLYESINFAVLKKLPVIYVCENNLYAVCSPQRSRQASDSIYKRFTGSGIPGYRVDGNNVLDVYTLSQKLIRAARQGRGPSFIEARTYRFAGHSGGGSDLDLGYRDEKELNAWKKKCPVKNYERFLLSRNVLTQKSAEKIRAVSGRETDAAFAAAKKSRLPVAGEIHRYVYADENQF